MRRLIAPLIALMAGAAQAQPLVTDLSSHLIAITSSYAGTELLIYGAAEVAGDVVVVVRGPEEQPTVWRKDRVLGLWVNRDARRFYGVPGFHAVAATRPLRDIASGETLARLQIGDDAIRLPARGRHDELTLAPYRQALIEAKREAGLYSAQAGEVSFLGPRLFRVGMAFPANVPIGTYTAEVYLFRNGTAIAAQAMPLFVDKIGWERQLAAMATRHPGWYGLAAVMLALAAGYLGALAFRRN
ncbi:MAG: hypothetical protein FJX46_17085 [Alphaproteobacteria bacterium]|nr:hypothetical protein [Alphaproteobacteria bacterium]